MSTPRPRWLHSRYCGKVKTAAFLMAAAAGLSACSALSPPEIAPYPEKDDVSVNAGYITGSMVSPETDVPSLSDVKNLRRVRAHKRTAKEEARYNAIRDAAQEYGLQAGQAFAGKLIHDRLQYRSTALAQTYDFNAVLLKDPSSAKTLLPPVISERDKTWELSDDGQSLRTADATYTIESDVTFADDAPLWHTYLYRSYEKPQLPSDDMLPENSDEQATWDRYVTDAYNRGVRQAIDTLRDDMRRLNHDYIGMWRYHWLLAEGRITSQYVAVDRMGITGSDQRVNMNEQQYHIAVRPKMNFDHPEKIKASVSTETPAEAGYTPPASGGPATMPANDTPAPSAP